MSVAMRIRTERGGCTKTAGHLAAAGGFAVEQRAR